MRDVARMKPRRIAIAVVALVLIAASAALIVAQLLSGPEPEPPDPIALWVCDQCRREARLPLANRSPDCPACAEGQMVQRAFFRCPACGHLFEAYQANWSPYADRAADCRRQADAHKALARECEQDPLLLRPPGGTWQWLECQGGDTLFSRLRCPRCRHEGDRRQFRKVLLP